MLGMSRRSMVFDFQLDRSASYRNNIGSMNLNRFTINACIDSLVSLLYPMYVPFSRYDRIAPLSLAISF